MSSDQPPRFAMIPSEIKDHFVPCIFGYAFVRNKDDYFVCKAYKTKKCPCRVKLLKNESGEYYDFTMKNKGDIPIHNHPGNDWIDSLQKKKVNEYAEQHTFSDMPIKQMMTEVYDSHCSLRQSTVAKQLRQALGASTTAATIEEIVLTPEEKEKLLFRDDRMIVFGDKRLFELIDSSSFIYSDGTFRVAPSLFLSLFIL